MKKIVLVGYGGHAKSVADCIERTREYEIVGYTDYRETEGAEYEYLGTDDALKEIFRSGVSYAFVCVGYLGKGDLREKLYSMLTDIGFTVPVIADPSAIISDNVLVGAGTFIGKKAVINADARIGKMCIINTGAIIEHECMVGDFSHISVGTVLCGQVKIGKSAFVGANATVIQCMSVADNETVPAGKTVR